MKEGRDLVELLESLSLSRKRLAEEIDVSRHTVEGWCSGKRRVPGVVLKYLLLLKAVRELGGA